MKKTYIYLGLILSVLVTSFWSCEKEYEAPTDEPNHAYITTSFGDQPARLQVNGSMSFIDLSRGIQSRTWTFTDDAIDTDFKAIATSTDEVVKVIFTEPGTHEIKISQIYAGNVYVGEEQLETSSYESTITVTVLDSVRADFTAKQISPEADLIHSAGALNEVMGGRDIEFTPVCTGEPTNFVWQFIREDGFIYENTDQVAVHKFSSLGTYDVRFIASSGFGADTIFMEDYIKVIPSTDPVFLLDMYTNTEMPTQIKMVFSRDMSNPATCNLNAFTLNVTNGGAPIPINIASLSLDAAQNNIVVINLESEIYNSDIVKLSYDATIGDIRTADLMDFDSFTDRELVFIAPNLLEGTSYDYSFENSTISQWAYLWWGAPWDGYTNSLSTAQVKDGSTSMLLDMHPEGGAIFEYRDQAGAAVTFNLTGDKTYEVGIWVYIEQLGGATINDLWVPDLRFFPNNAGTIDWTGCAYFFPAELKTNEWVYMKAEWKPGDFSGHFVIRGYNKSSTVNHIMYIDNITISEKVLR